MRSRTLTRALDKLTFRIPVWHEARPCGLVDLWAFWVPRPVIVEPSAKLKDLDNHAKFGVFYRYKNGGGGYHVWGPEREGVVKLQVELEQRQLALPPFTTLSTLVLMDHLSRRDPWTVQPCITGDHTNASVCTITSEDADNDHL